MQQFDNDFGKLFYCIYTLYKRQLISLERKGRLKDLLVSTDDCMKPLIKNIKLFSESQVHEHLLMMTDSQYECKQESETEENQSIKSSRTLQIGRLNKPQKLVIKNSNYQLAERSPDPLSTRSSQKRTSSSIKNS